MGQPSGLQNIWKRCGPFGVLDGVSQLGRARRSHTSKLHTCTRRASSWNPASAGECIKEHVNDNRGTCGARKNPSSESSHRGYTLFPQRSGCKTKACKDREEIDHLVKVQMQKAVRGNTLSEAN